MRLSKNKVIDLAKRSLTPDRPYHAQWFLTRRCNYRCRTCNIWRDVTSSTEMSADEIKKGLDVLRKLGVIDLVLSGGNPLLREDIEEILEYASRFFITTVYDNGSRAAKKIEALRNADFVAISIDSLDENRNDFLRGVPGATRKALGAIRTLKKEGISVGVAATISKANIHEMLDFTGYFVSHGIPVWYALYSYDNPLKDRLFAVGRKSDEFKFSRASEVVDFCEGLREMKKKNTGIFMPNKVLVALQELFEKGARTWKCKALRSFLMVDHRGKIAGCHYYPPVADTTNVLGLWRTGRFDKYRQSYARCAECTYLCYVFYSLYSDIPSNAQLLYDEAKSALALNARSIEDSRV